MRIEGCTIETGDDCISLKSGRGLNGARIGKPTEDVLIRNCKMHDRVFACVGVGSETSAGVRNVKIENCKMSAPRSYAIYIKSRIGRAGITENISGEDLDVPEGGFLRVNLVSGGNMNTADDPVEGFLGYPEGRNFAFVNIRFNGGTLADVSQISADKPLDGLRLENVSGTCAKGIALQHTRNAVLKKVNLEGFSGALISTNDVSGTGLDSAAPYLPVGRK